MSHSIIEWLSGPLHNRHFSAWCVIPLSGVLTLWLSANPHPVRGAGLDLLSVQAGSLQPQRPLTRPPSTSSASDSASPAAGEELQCPHCRAMVTAERAGETLPDGTSFVSVNSDPVPEGRIPWLAWCYRNRNNAAATATGYTWMDTVEGHGNTEITAGVAEYRRLIRAIGANPTHQQYAQALIDATRFALRNDRNAVCRHHAYLMCRIANRLTARERPYTVEFHAQGYSSSGHCFNSVIRNGNRLLVDPLNDILTPPLPAPNR